MPTSSDQGLESYRGSRALVLGGAGFIGRWVVRALELRGAQTVAVVRDAAAGHRALRAVGAKAQLIESDLTRLGELPDLLRSVRPSITFNLAGYGVDPSERAHELAYLINAELPGALCEALSGMGAPEWPGQALVHVGSAAEYGTSGGNLDEDSPARPTRTYGASKLAGTRLLGEHASRSGLRALTARLFTVYGPGEHPERLLPSLLRTARSGQALDLTAGSQQRDFTYVEDVAEGLIRLGASRASPGAAINLATGTLTSVRQFAEKAAFLLGISEELLRFGVAPSRPDEMKHDPVTISQLRHLVSWSPTTSVEDGIRRTIQLADASSQPG